MRREPLVRTVLAVAVGAGLVVAAASLPGTATIGTTGTAQSTPSASASVVPVRLTELTCPGPETEGIPGVPAVSGGTSTVLAAAAPAEAIGGLGVGTSPGSLTVTARPQGIQLATGGSRTRLVSGTLTGPTIGSVTGTGSLAPGVAGLQTWLRRDGDDRGLDAAACQTPRSEAWLLAGGGDSTRRERLVVANPGANALTVDVEVYGNKGKVPSTAGSRIAVPPLGRVSLLIDGIAPGETSPVVHVVATGGLVTALVEDAWIEGAVGRGRDDSAPADGPATEQVVPAAFVNGPALLRLFVPGDGEAVVQSRVLTSSGSQALPADGVVRIAGHTVRDIDLSALPAGAYAVQARADQPVLAAVMLQRRGPVASGPSDLAWATSTPVIPVLTGSPVPAGAKASLMVVSTGGVGMGTLYAVAPDGTVTTNQLTIQADTVTAVDVSGAASVWVRQSQGTLRAGLAVELEDTGGLLVSVVGLWPSAVTATDVPVREIRH
jgi:hypothetical protein